MPRKRSLSPGWLVSGTFMRTVLPPSVTTPTSPPSTAVDTGTVTRVVRSRPFT